MFFDTFAEALLCHHGFPCKFSFHATFMMLFIYCSCVFCRFVWLPHYYDVQRQSEMEEDIDVFSGVGLREVGIYVSTQKSHKCPKRSICICIQSSTCEGRHWTIDLIRHDTSGWPRIRHLPNMLVPELQAVLRFENGQWKLGTGSAIHMNTERRIRRVPRRG